MEIALAGVRSAVAERLGASSVAVPDSPTAQELAARRATVAELWRGLAGECAALLRLAVRAALARAWAQLERVARALAASADVPETATQCAEGAHAAQTPARTRARWCMVIHSRRHRGRDNGGWRQPCAG